MFFDISWGGKIIVLTTSMCIILITFTTIIYFVIRDFLIDKKLLLDYKKAKKMFDENPNNILLKDVVDIYQEIIKRFNIK